MNKNLLKAGLSIIGASSFCYGFYRSWTLPIWKQKKIELLGEYTREFCFRGILSTYTGIIYMFPPITFIKIYHFYLRVQDVRCEINYGLTRPKHWREIGFYHPSVF